MSTPFAHHTEQDVQRLQRLLDDTHRRANAHLREIHTDNVRRTAAQVVEHLPSMHVMVVATVSSDGRPFTGPVDAFLHHGDIVFGTAEGALRHRHLTRDPSVSVTYVEGEAFVLTVHGRARRAELDGRDAAFRDRALAHYGTEAWDQFLSGSPYWVVQPDRVLAADMSLHLAQDA